VGEEALAVASWLGTLTKAGVVQSGRQQTGQALAASVVGEDRVDLLRAWLEEQPTTVRDAAQEAAAEVLIHMAFADRELAEAEQSLLLSFLSNAELPPETQRKLVRRVAAPDALHDIATRLPHPVLRELLLTMGWEMALADGRIDPKEREFYARLAKLLDVSWSRAVELRKALHQEF